MIWDAFLRALRGAGRGGKPAPRWERFEEAPARLYAIGDVHGRVDLVRALESSIVEDAQDVSSDKWLVYLGDYVSRGPQSAQVLDHLLKPPPDGFRRICLAGNHELMMLDFISNRNVDGPWMRSGGIEALLSYGLSPQQLSRRGLRAPEFWSTLQSYVPEEHLDFLRHLPNGVELPDYLLVHAGIRPGVSLERQTIEDLTLSPGAFYGKERPSEKTVIHGHRIVEEVVRTGNRFDVDTGAYATGRLSAVRLSRDGPPRILTQSGNAVINTLLK
ncbi:MAG TPA: metallophosphoesterase family protein [Mesorhizobium sp.]